MPRFMLNHHCTQAITNTRLKTNLDMREEHRIKYKPLINIPDHRKLKFIHINQLSMFCSFFMYHPKNSPSLPINIFAEVNLRYTYLYCFQYI